MESIISTFHVDWQIMIAQLVNFAIVVAVLWFFVFRPLNEKMAERTEKIKKSLDEAKQISQSLQATEAKNNQLIKEAKEKSAALIAEATARAESERERILIQAKSEVEKVIIEGKKRLIAEQDEAVEAAKGRLADLVVLVAEKFLTGHVDKKNDKKAVERIINDLK